MGQRKGLKKDNINLDEVVYYLLHGWGLRKLGRKYGVCHTYMCALLQRKYGKGITNPEVTSLARSLIGDYKGDASAYEYALSVVGDGERGDSRFKSNSALQAASKWLVLPKPELMDTIARYHDREMEYLRGEGEYPLGMNWQLTYLMLNYIVVILGGCYYSNIGRLVASEAIERGIEDGIPQAG